MESEELLVESGTESLDLSPESQPDTILSDVPEEIGSAPEPVIEHTEAVTLIPIRDEDLSVAEWGFIGFGAAGACLLISLGVATIIRIFWRSAS